MSVDLGKKGEYYIYMDAKKQALIDKHMHDLERVWVMRVVERELQYNPAPKEMSGCRRYLRQALTWMSIAELQEWNVNKTSALAVDLMRENKRRRDQEGLSKTK